MYSVYLNVHIQEYGELLHQIVSAAVLLILLQRRGDLAGTPRACFAVSQKLARPHRHTHTHTNAHAEILVRHTQTHRHYSSPLYGQCANAFFGWSEKRRCVRDKSIIIRKTTYRLWELTLHLNRTHTHTRALTALMRAIVAQTRGMKSRVCLMHDLAQTYADNTTHHTAGHTRTSQMHYSGGEEESVLGCVCVCRR